VTVSPPLPPPPGVDPEDRFVIQRPTFDTGGSGMGNVGAEYAGDYARENYASRMSRMHQDEVDWIPESYLEKGWLIAICLHLRNVQRNQAI